MAVDDCDFSVADLILRRSTSDREPRRKTLLGDGAVLLATRRINVGLSSRLSPIQNVGWRSGYENITGECVNALSTSCALPPFYQR